jgi:molybdopterin-guanine dinucleotide biosynthesis protein A
VTPKAVGVVLAGGAASRMGGDKASLPLAGRPLIAYPVEALRRALGDVAIVAKRETQLPALEPPPAVWHEPDEPRHPLTGIVEALRRADGRPLIVLACDLPLVSAELVAELAAAPSSAPALVASAGGVLQPLCARYEPAALELLEGFDPGARLMTQVEALSPATFEVEADVLHNVNEPADLAAVEALLGGRRPSPGQTP